MTTGTHTSTATRSRSSRTPLIVAGVIVVLLFLLMQMGGSAATDYVKGDSQGPAARGGDAIIGFDQQPAALNPHLTSGGMAVGTNIFGVMFDGWVDTTTDGQYIPRVASTIPTTDNGLVRYEGEKMIVEFPIEPTAQWSDGTPITCSDMQFTHATIMNDKWLIGSRVGWEKIESVECPNPKTVVLNFSEPYAPYMRILGGAPLPKHELEGKDFNNYWNARITVSNGPYVFDYWKRNVELRVKRNENYWAKGREDIPYLDGLTFRFLKDTNTLKIQVRTGEVDFIMPPPDTNLKEELESLPRSEYQVTPGGFWEQLAFNARQKPLDNPDVRRAVIYSVDRRQITDVVLKKQVEPLNSTLLPEVKQYYDPAWAMYEPDDKKVEEHLKKAGYTRDGEWWTKDGKPLEIVFKSTAGNVLRMKVGQLLQQQLKANGIKLELAFENAAVFFSQSAPQGNYGIGLWAWSSSVDPSQTTLFSCDQIPSKANQFQGNNNYGYCNPEVTRLLKEADAEPDVAKRAALSKRTQQLMADDAALLPLYQRPESIAYSGDLNGVKINALGSTFTSTREWWFDAQ